MNRRGKESKMSLREDDLAAAYDRDFVFPAFVHVRPVSHLCFPEF